MICNTNVMRLHCSVCGHMWYIPLYSEVPKECPKCYFNKNQSWDGYEEAKEVSL